MAKRKKNEPITSLSPLHKKKGPRQTEIPGTERKKIPGVEEAFESFDERKQEYSAARTAQQAAHDAVVAAMEEAKVKTYSYPSSDGTTITITLKGGKTKVHVHKKKPEAFRDDGDEE